MIQLLDQSRLHSLFSLNYYSSILSLYFSLVYISNLFYAFLPSLVQVEQICVPSMISFDTSTLIPFLSRLILVIHDNNYCWSETLMCLLFFSLVLVAYDLIYLVTLILSPMCSLLALFPFSHPYNLYIIMLLYS